VALTLTASQAFISNRHSHRPGKRRCSVVSLNANASDVSAFVTHELGIEVLTQFEVKPWKRRFDPDGHLRRAFRICIYDDTKHRFLVEEKWPNRISVYA
jgi:hypothetical protein